MYELAVTRLIDAPPETVWQAMTERMGEWWAPKPWRAVVERFDRRPGGASLIALHGPDGEVNRHPGFVLAWDEGRRFSITDAIEGDLQPSGPFMLGIWEIAKEGSGTRYTARARHWTPESKAHHLEMGFVEGWGVVADQLKALCEGS